ncbi:MAG: transcriptional repressor [Bradymonadales bacterium]|nr:MAG: transcriptional repressor [Bradymonadales bacterium]
MSFEAIRQKLNDLGIQASAPRVAIADFVLNTRSHPTAEEVRIAVEKKMPSVSLATVYNTLNLLTQHGLIRAVKDPGTEKLRYDCNVEPHFHFYDESTGELTDLDPRLCEVDTKLLKIDASYEIAEIDVLIRGRKKKSPNEKCETR